MRPCCFSNRDKNAGQQIRPSYIKGKHKIEDSLAKIIFLAKIEKVLIVISSCTRKKKGLEETYLPQRYLTRMNSNSKLELFLRKVFDFKVTHVTQKIKGHVGDFSSMTNAIGLG